MISLEDSIDINASLDSLYDWLCNLDKNFVVWNPSHTEFKKLSGGLNTGDKIQFTEIVKGISYKVKGTIKERTKNQDSFTMIFEAGSGFAHIYFLGNKTETGCRFTHIEEFGKPDTFFGKIINFLVFKVIVRKKADWNLILDDMKEDNIYLKNFLETGKYGYEE